MLKQRKTDHCEEHNVLCCDGLLAAAVVHRNRDLTGFGGAGFGVGVLDPDHSSQPYRNGLVSPFEQP